ncbi:MAG: response regulator [Acidobacteriota bacterium]
MDSASSREQLLRQIRILQARVADLEREKGPPAGAGAANLEGLGQFAGSIAHDLNNLLVAVLGNAGLALMDLSPYSACRPLIQEVEDAAQRAAELANQMLTLAGEALSETPPAVMEPVLAEPSGVITMPQAVTTSWRGQGLVLVVDDELMVRMLAKRILEKFGFQVMTADDGRQAIEVFRPHAREFVAVLLDVTMPNLDGADAFRALRSMRPDLKVILSSGYDEGQATRQISRKELAGFLPKPYLPMDLIDLMRDILEESA